MATAPKFITIPKYLRAISNPRLSSTQRSFRTLADYNFDKYDKQRPTTFHGQRNSIESMLPVYGWTGPPPTHSAALRSSLRTASNEKRMTARTGSLANSFQKSYNLYKDEEEKV